MQTLTFTTLVKYVQTLDQQKDQITLDVEHDFIAFRKYQLELKKLVKIFIKDIKLVFYLFSIIK